MAGEPVIPTELPTRLTTQTDHPRPWLSYEHWGMDAGSSASTGTQYNDEIQVWRLDAPLENFEAAPDCDLGG